MAAVLRSPSFTRHWLPVLVWAACIFIASSDLFNAANSGGLLRRVLHFVGLELNEPWFHAVQMTVRKAAHLAEYALLAALLWRAFNGVSLGRVRPWPRRLAWRVWSLSVAYAVSDEFHQTFVPSREGHVRDVAIDAAGAALALGLIWWWGRRAHRWRERADTLPPALASDAAP